MHKKNTIAEWKKFFGSYEGFVTHLMKKTLLHSSQSKISKHAPDMMYKTYTYNDDLALIVIFNIFRLSKI